MSDRLRVGVIGTGFVGPHHVDAARRTGLADVVALAGSSVERARPKAALIGVERVVTVDELLADPSIDVVHVCTPNASHAELGRRALDAGKHVVMEKPLALDADEAADLRRRAAAAGRHAAVAFTYRGYPMIRRARADARGGRLGEVRIAFGAYLQDWLLDASDYNWRVEADAGGRSRAVADIGSHWFDTVEHVSGLRVSEVMADLRTFITHRIRPRDGTTTFARGGADGEQVPIHSEDAAGILVRFEGGAIGTFLISQVSAGHANDLSWELMGSAASLAWRQEEPELLRYGEREVGTTTVRRSPPSEPMPGVPPLPGGHPEGWSDALRDLFRDIYASIKRDASPSDVPYPTFADGERAVRFVDAVLRSAERGRWEQI